MKNTFKDLNNYLFEELERLNDDEAMKDEEVFNREIERSKAISSVAAQIINNGNLSLRAYQAATEHGIEAKVPALGLIES